MNSFVILLVAGVALAQGAATPNLKEQFQAVTKKCAQETKATPENVKVMTARVLPANDVEKCFLECVYKGAGIVKDNAFSVEGAKKLAAARFTKTEDLNKINALIDSCAKEIAPKEGEKCSLGLGVRSCILKNGKDIQFFSKSS